MLLIDRENRRVNITNSARQTYDTCQMKLYLGNVLNGNGIRKDMGSTGALLIGDVMHRQLSDTFEGRPPHEVVARAMAYVNKAEEEVRIPTEKSDMNFLKARAIVEAFPELADEICRTIKRDYEIVSVEKTYEMGIGELQVNDGPPWEVVLYGKIDAVLRDSTGRLVVMDHKTVSAFKASFYDRCAFDHQIGGYILLTNEDIRPNAVYPGIYNCIRKPAIRLKKNETMHQFSNRIKDDWGGQELDEVVKTIKVLRRPEELYETGRNFVAVARDMLMSYLDTFWRRNMSSCDIYSGCPFLDICAKNDADMVNYIPKDSAHEELASSDDESW